MSFDLLGILYKIYVRLFNEKDFESEKSKERKNKKKNRKYEDYEIYGKYLLRMEYIVAI